MGKSKVTDKSSKKDKKAELSSVKAGRVTKPAQAPKAKSKDIAKAAVKEKKKSKKAKTPTPEPESESSASDQDEDDSSDSSADEKVEKKAPAKAAAKADSDSDSSDESDSEEEKKPAAKANGVKTNGATKAAPKDDSSDSESGSDSDSSASEAEKPAAKAAKADSDSDSGDDSSDSSSDSESDEEEAPSKKRKAEAEVESVVKKTKTEAPAAGGDGIKNLFVGSLSWNIDEDWLRREFEHFGDITGCRVITDRESGRSKGFGYVEFANAADAAKAQKEMHEYELDGRSLNVDFSTPREKPDQGARANKYGDKRSAPANTLFLGNLSFDATNDGIQEIFAEYGTITRVSLPTDRDTGSLKGFGYVDFTTKIGRASCRERVSQLV